MATFTSKATGNWGSAGQTTWNEVGTPGNGDTATINSGHVVTAAANVTVGTSGAADTVDIINKGTFIVAAGVTFKHRGTIEHWNGSLTEVKEGGHLKHDSTASGSPTTIYYRIRGRLYPDNSASDSWELRLTGTNNANRGNIDADRTGGALGAQIGAGAYDFVGDAANGLKFVSVWGYIDVDAMNTNYGYWYEATDTVWSANCQLWDFGQRIQPSGKFNQIRVQYLFGGGNMIMTQREGYAPSGAGQRTIQDVMFGATWGTTGANWDLSGRIIFYDGITNYPGSKVLSWPDGVFMRRNPGGASAQTLTLPGGPSEFKRFAMMIDDPSNTNATLQHTSNYNRAATIDIHDFVVQCDINGSSGDALHNSDDCVLTVRNGIMLANFTGGPCGVIMQADSAIASRNSFVKLRHMTGYIDSQAPLVIAGETEETAVGAVMELHSNILVREYSDAGTGEVYMGMSNLVNQDVPDPTKAGKNVQINITGPHPFANDTTYGPFYVGLDASPVVFSTAPLGGDINLSGALSLFFTDPTRDYRSYAVYRGLASGGDSDATKKAALLNAIRAQVNVADPNYNANVGVEDMIDWIREGWTPTDLAIKIAFDSENGGWSGAVQGIEAETPKRRATYYAVSSSLHKQNTQSVSKVLMGRSIVEVLPHGLRRMATYVAGFVRKGGRFKRENPTTVTTKNVYPFVPPTIPTGGGIPKIFWWFRRNRGR